MLAQPAATSLQLVQATRSLLQRPSHLRKCSLAAELSSWALLTFSLSEVAGMNKVINNPRTNAWPMHGGLQSITNTSGYRNPASRSHVDVATKQVSAVPAIPEAAEPIILTRTPSPKKVTIKVEPASGKENAGVVA